MNPKEFANFNLEHVDRIILATRLDTPSDFDRKALLADMIDAWGRYKKLINSGAFRRQQDRQVSIRKHIKRIVELLREDDEAGGVIDKLSHGASEILAIQLIDLACLLEYGTQAAPAEFVRFNKERYGLTGSALQELVGAYLPGVYHKHFKREARSSHSGLRGGPPDGPYIRFALQATKEMKIECSAETVDAALGEKKIQKNTL